MKRLSRLLAVSLLTAAPAFSQTPATRPAAPIDYETARLSRVVTAIRITDRINVDGHLDEAAWQLATPATDFVTRLPREGQLSAERTEVRFLYDDDNLYVGAIAFDSDIAHITINELKKDFNFGQNDLVTVSIDSLHDRRSGFFFNLNPAGARRDGQIFNDGQNNVDWDGVWDGKTSIGPQAWIAEMAIPFKTLRFAESATQEWGVNMGRRVSRINEESQWSPIPTRFAGLKISMAGTLKGLENVRQGRNLKVKPFVTTGLTELRDADGQLQTTRSLSRLEDYDGGLDAKFGLTPSLTLDATYRTDFAQVEVDQQQVNLTRFNVFFPEKRDFFLENSGTFSFGGGGNGDNVLPFFSRRIGLAGTTPIPIVGGARVSGQASRYDVGLLAMRTESLGSTPANNYLVGRVKRNLLARSWIGALMTSRDSTTSGDYNRVFGTDAFFVFFNKLEIDSYILKSDTPGKAGRDLAGKFSTAWRGDEWVLAGEYHTVQKNFDPQVGFIRRKDAAQFSGDLNWQPRLRRSRTIRNLIFQTSADRIADSDGHLETRTQGFNSGIAFVNGGSVNFRIDRTFERLVEDFNIRTGIPIPIGDYQYLSYTGSVSTNPVRRIAGNANLTAGEFWNGHRKSYGGGLTWRPNYRLNVTLDYSRNDVDLPNGDFTTDLLGTRWLWGFSPQAFLNAFFQYNTDTHEVSSNVRFNLLHHPLSDLYLVYNERRNTSSDQLVERAFIVKLTNLFNF